MPGVSGTLAKATLKTGLNVSKAAVGTVIPKVTLGDVLKKYQTYTQSQVKTQ